VVNGQLEMEATTALVWLTLVTLATPTGDNATEAGFSYNLSTTTQGRSSSYSSYYISPTLSLVFYVITVITAVVGCLANACVLLAMLLSKNSRASNVNVFITHQNVMDFTTCAFLFVGLVLDKVDVELSEPTAWFLCYVFGTHAITTMAGNASVCGLIIITIERYLKIVHPVAYRNRYRSWMMRAGIIIPWIFGIFMSLIPIWATSRVVSGRCLKNRYYANNEIRVAWGVAKFLLLYLGPLVFLIFGYWKILAKIRRQSKQIGHGQTSGTSNGATLKEQTRKRTEMNIIKTMVLVAVSFAVCFVCMKTYSVLTRLDVVPGIGALYLLFSVFSYTNRCLNPFIYATQYEVVRRWWKAVVCRAVGRQNVVEATIPMSAAPPDTAGRQPSTSKSQVQTTKNL